MKRKQFRGKCMGVTLEPRGPGDNHIMVTLEIEDDENWFEKMSVSSYWIDELIEQLQAAKKYCETQKPDKDNKGKQYGWNFK